MEESSFRCCPRCGGGLLYGRMQIPASRRPGIINGFTDQITFFTEEEAEYIRKHPLKTAFTSGERVTNFAVFKQPCIPAVYCEKCDRIFADIEMRAAYNPIGEDNLLINEDESCYQDDQGSIKEENIYVQEKDPYEEWNDLIDWSASDSNKQNGK